MEEYNLLVLEGKVPQIAILQTAAYRRMINNRPDLRHENLGNFYSEVSCENLANKVDEILSSISREKFFCTDDLAGDVVWNLLVEMAPPGLGERREIAETPFAPSPDNMDITYIIKYNHGAGVYCPRIYSEGIDPTFSNAALSVFLLHGLSNDKDGTAMKSLDYFVSDVRKCLTEARKELAGITKFIKSHNRNKPESEDDDGSLYLALYGEIMGKITEIAEDITESARKISERSNH